MRNLKVTRQLRGQSAPGLRRQLRKASERITALENTNARLERENTRLRRTPIQNLAIPKDFSDRLIARFCEHLARGMARKVSDEVPELGQAAQATARYMHEFLSGRMSPQINAYQGISYTVEEAFNGNDVKFSLYLRDVSVHYTEDYRMTTTAYNYSPESVRIPPHVHMSNRDFASS